MKFTTPGFIISCLFVCISAMPFDVGAEAIPLVDFSIHNINLRSGRLPKQTGRTLSERMECHVNTFNEALSRYNIDWDLVAVSEAEQVDCYLTNSSISATDCLAEGIRGNHNIWTHQFNEYGIIVNLDKFEVIGETEQAFGFGLGTAQRRGLLGVHLRIRDNGKQFVFASTHINTTASHYCTRKNQVDGVIQSLQAWRLPGTNLSMVAGDFNCEAGGWTKSTNCSLFWDTFLSKSANSAKLCAYMAKHFIDANNFNNIEINASLSHGSSSMSGSPVGRFIGHRRINEFVENRCSDHPDAFSVVRTGCEPNCTGKQCGSDGCGGSCGSCSGSAVCQGGTCQQCTPHCFGECGADGCGGSCGTCRKGYYCTGEQKCQPAGTSPL